MSSLITSAIPRNSFFVGYFNFEMMYGERTIKITGCLSQSENTSLAISTPRGTIPQNPNNGSAFQQIVEDIDQFRDTTPEIFRPFLNTVVGRFQPNMNPPESAAEMMKLLVSEDSPFPNTENSASMLMWSGTDDRHQNEIWGNVGKTQEAYELSFAGHHHGVHFQLNITTPNWPRNSRNANEIKLFVATLLINLRLLTDGLIHKMPGE